MPRTYESVDTDLATLATKEGTALNEAIVQIVTDETSGAA